MFDHKASVGIVDAEQICVEQMNKAVTMSHYLPNAEFETIRIIELEGLSKHYLVGG